MALNTVLVLAAGLGFAGAAQDPSLDTQIVTPVLGASQGTTSGATATQGKVTVQFRGVKASEVFSWLENRGVNFVVSQSEVAKDTNISLNLQDVTLDAAVDAIARALGGHWEKENGIRIFKRGESPFRFYSGPDLTAGGRVNGNFRPATPAPKIVEGTPLPPFTGFKTFDQGDAKVLPPEFAKDMEKWSKTFGKEFANGFTPEQQQRWQKEFGPEFEQRMKKWSEEFSKSFGPEYQKRMEKEFGPEFQERMKKMAAEMQRQYGSQDSEQMRKLREEAAREGRVYKRNKDGTYSVDKEELARIRQEAAQEAVRARAEGDRARREGDRARQEGARARVEAQRIRERALGDARSRTWVTPRVNGGSVYTVRPGRNGDLRFFRDQDGFRAGEGGSAVDIKKFLRNLTPDQRDRQRKRGFIWWDDLTREQKELFGGRPDGRFEIHYKLNDDEITIRGN
jgi:hypothetical protein